MKKQCIYLLILLLSFGLYSCEEVEDLLFGNLTNEEITDGLKTALTVGSDTSVTILSATDGYFKDEAVKILLPPEAKVIEDNINQVPGLGTAAIEALVLKINRSAEDAAIEAKPIFVNAITDMSISDGLSILQGKNPAGTQKSMTTEFDSTAATNYLKAKTYDQLQDAFAPKINTSLDKEIVDGVSTSKTWTTVTSTYNLVAPFIGKPSVDTDLGEFVTTKALDGLFLKVGNAEKGIRNDPVGWALQFGEQILDKVFGAVYEE